MSAQWQQYVNIATLAQRVGQFRIGVMHHGRHGCLDGHAELGKHGGHGGAESAQAAQINLHLQVALLEAPKAACAPNM